MALSQVKGNNAIFFNGIEINNLADDAISYEIGDSGDVLSANDTIVHLRKNSMKVTKNINEQGYNYESTVKITALRGSAIVSNDVVTYRGLEYRILDDNYKESGNYTSFIAGYTKESIA